jgi:2-polyprenyl-6-methoxyphenol hydroxylase-like FAD-dependent oxidoreductase
MSQKPLQVIIVSAGLFIRHYVLIVHKIGGSLSGLFSGIALKRLGYNVRILERDNGPWLRHRGAGIVLGADVQSFLHSYAPAQRPFVVISRSRQYVDRGGTVTESQECPQVMGSWDALYHVLRAQFDGLCSVFCESAPRLPGDGEAIYQFDQNVTSIRDAGDVVEVHSVTEGGQKSILYGDLIIGADGPSSIVRKYLEPNARAKRRYGGYVAWRGVVNEADISQEARDLFGGNLSFFHAPQTQILA